MKKKGFVKYFVYFLVSFVFVTLFSRSTSFLYVFEGADPAIFKQMGLAILKGNLIYVDYFDNKGCLLYFIHALGLGLGGDHIILIMQAISLTITLYMWNQMLALYHNQKQQYLGLGISLILLLCFYGAGDQTQEWCLPFISYPLLLFLRANKNHEELSPKQLLQIGLCFGVITFIQINNACAFLGFVIYSWWKQLAKKDYQKLLRGISGFILGWVIIAIPCVLYFYIKAGWLGVYEMVYASFLSNFEYLRIQRNPVWFHWLPYTIFIISVLLILWVNLRKQKDLFIPIIISFLLFFASFGKQCNSFYLIAILPLIVIILTAGELEFKKNRLFLYGLTIITALFMGSIVLFHFVNDFILQKEKHVTIYQDFHNCIENIPEQERDSIFNYNLFWHGYGMMQHEGLLQCNRVTLAYNLPTLIEDEVSKNLALPKWMMISFDFDYYTNDAYYILEDYELNCSFLCDNRYLSKVNIGQVFEVRLYRRKY